MSHCEHPTYIATAPVIEDGSEWLARIEHHRKNRSKRWQLIEEELELTSVLEKTATEGGTVLVDCLTLWLSNLMFSDKHVDAEIAALCEMLPTLAGHIILVSNKSKYPPAEPEALICEPLEAAFTEPSAPCAPKRGYTSCN